MVRRSLYNSTCTQRVAFVAVDDPSRVYSLSFSLSFTVLPLSFHTLCLCLFLAFFVSVYVYVLSVVIHSSLLRIRRFSQVSKDQTEALRGPKINSLYAEPLAFPHLFCPPRYLALIVSRSSATFLRWLRSSLRRNDATLRMYPPFARKSHHASSTSFTNAFAIPVAQTNLIATLRSQNCIGLTHASCILYSSRYIRVSIYTSPYPRRAKTRPCSKMTDRPSNQPHLRILTLWINSLSSPCPRMISTNTFSLLSPLSPPHHTSCLVHFL